MTQKKEGTVVEPGTEKPAESAAPQNADNAKQQEINDLIGDTPAAAAAPEPAAEGDGKPAEPAKPSASDGIDAITGDSPDTPPAPALKPGEKPAEKKGDEPKPGDSGQPKPEEKPLTVEEQIKMLTEKVTTFTTETARIKEQNENLKIALRESRSKRKEARERIEALMKKAGVEPTKIKMIFEGKEVEREVDPEIVQTIGQITKEMISPESTPDEKQAERAEMYMESAQQVEAAVGKENYDHYVNTVFSQFIDPQSPRFNKDIAKAFAESEHPAALAYTLAVGTELPNILQKHRTKVESELRPKIEAELKEKIRGEVLKELMDTDGKLIPALSEVPGGAPSGVKPSTIKKEVEDLVT